MCVKPTLFLDEPALFQIPRVHSHEPKLPGNHQQQWSIRALPHLREQGEGRRLTSVSTQIGCELNCER
jgi:adenine C2-methylase RlmN of 23S rRNA A2503 and tRNA A37